MNHIGEVQKLKREIAIARENLQRIWNARGLTDASVIKASDKFDALLNEYQRALKANMRK